MWIRTQDKLGLFELKGFKIREHVFENGTKEYLVLGNDNLYNHLGTYNSKERAIEVLNEIQTWIERYEAAKVSGKLFIAFITYEMPKE